MRSHPATVIDLSELTDDELAERGPLDSNVDPPSPLNDQEVAMREARCGRGRGETAVSDAAA